MGRRGGRAAQIKRAALRRRWPANGFADSEIGILELRLSELRRQSRWKQANQVACLIATLERIELQRSGRTAATPKSKEAPASSSSAGPRPRSRPRQPGPAPAAPAHPPPPADLDASTDPHQDLSDYSAPID